MNEIKNHQLKRFHLLSFLKEYKNFNSTLMEEFHGKNIQYDYQRVLFNFLLRLHTNVHAIEKISSELLNNIHFKLPFFSLIRPLISDVIIIHYLLDKLRFNSQKEMLPIEEEFFQRLGNLTYDFVKRAEGVLEDSIKDNRITPTERQKIIEGFQNNYPDHYTNNKLKKKSVASNPKTLLKEIEEKGYYPRLKAAYDLYFQLSQYEHFSEVTEHLMIMDDENSEQALTLIFESLLMILSTQHSLLNAFFVEKKDLNTLVDLINSLDKISKKNLG
ncbi:hypothetical protein OKW21_005822 [Catalinimonas alkaloidigena]|uniref:hypothetical protein n=1 Tax=Catalinimonas alkaloidigena TaxID=1075417 RepID=UPI002405FED7|nr:hypothetical protein [Catalinimonas alkaloidigena]MDF9800559.1 hypothetical protein [Catalinimonas alkaloidigena]